MAQTTSLVKCPICSQSYVNWMINQHIEGCLLRNDAKIPSGKLEGTNSCTNSGTKLSKSPEFTQNKKTKLSSLNAGNKLFKSPKSSENRKHESRLFTSPPLKRAKMEKAPTTSGVKQNDDQVQIKPISKQHAHQEVNGTQTKREKFVPLAEKLRPRTLDEYVGQTKIVGDKSMLKNLLGADEVPSMIFWGPPGCGKVNFMF